MQVLMSQLASSLNAGTRTLDWWIMDASGDEFTPGAVRAEQHMRMCDALPDDNLAQSLFVQLPLGSYLFRAKYTSATDISVTSGDCSLRPESVITDALGPGADDWSVTLLFGVCPADLNGNNTVNIDDLVALLGAFGPCPPFPAACPADIAPPGGNGEVNIDDLTMLLGNFGACPTTPPGNLYELFLRDHADWYGALVIDISTPTVDHSVTDTTVGAAAPNVGCFDLGGCINQADGVGGLWFVFTGNGQPLDVSLCGSAEPDANTVFLDALRIFEACTPSSFPACTTIEPLNHGSGQSCVSTFLNNGFISSCAFSEPIFCEWDSGYDWSHWNGQPTVAGAHYWIFVHGINLPPGSCDPNRAQVAQGPFTLTVSEPIP